MSAPPTTAPRRHVATPLGRGGDADLRREPATEKAAEQVERILDATVRSIAKHGYAASSLARIAAEAGTTKRMVLYYFENREQLFTELVHRITANMVAVTQADVDAEDELAVGIRRSVRHLWEMVIGDRELVCAYFAVLGEAGANEQLRASLDHVRTAHLEVVQQHLERAAELGIQPPVDRDMLSVMMFAGFRGLLLEFYERGRTPALEQAFGLLEASIVAAFTPPADSR